MIVAAFAEPRKPRPVFISACASSRCWGVMSFMGRPLRSRGMKCQLTRSASSKAKVARVFCSGESEARNTAATWAICAPAS